MNKRFLILPSHINPDIACEVIYLLISGGRLESETGARLPLRRAVSKDHKGRPLGSRIELGFEDWD